MRRSSGYVQALVDGAIRRDGLGVSDLAGAGYFRKQVHCYAPECSDSAGNGRPFFGVDKLREHAEAVHTFDDIRRLLSDFLREKFGKTGDYNAEPPIPGIWVWIDDLADDWVVFSKEEGNESTLLKADYSIDDKNQVTLGTPVEVVRRTVYDPVE